MPGRVFTIGQVINLGKKELVILKDGWTTVTRDGSLYARFGQLLLVAGDGYESRTHSSVKITPYCNIMSSELYGKLSSTSKGIRILVGR
jgi:hypothetical protein